MTFVTLCDWQVLKKMAGAEWPTAKIEFDRWRSAGKSIFPKEVWDAADKNHGYQWWHSFGDDFKVLNKIAAKLLSKPISASACEFNWSDVSQVASKRTTQRSDANIERMVNIRAMYKLEQGLKSKVLLGNIPKLDDFLDLMVNDAIDQAEGGVDVAEPEDLPENAESEDDEQYNVVEDDIEELYELGGRNDHLDNMVAEHL